MSEFQAGVLHIHKEQPLGGQGGPGQAALFLAEDLLHTLRAALAQPRLHQGAGQNPHHVVEVAVRREGEQHPAALPLDPAGPQGADGISPFGHRGARRTEGGKVVPARQPGGGCLHDLQVQRRRDPVGVFRLKGALHRAVPDAIAVGLPVGGVAGVEALGHLLGLQHPDVRRQPEIQGQRQLFQGEVQPLAPEIQGIFQGMDAGVGAAAALDVGPQAQQRGQGLLKDPRHRDPVFLHLKAVVGGALEAEGEQDVHGQNPLATSRVESTSTK